MNGMRMRRRGGERYTGRKGGRGKEKKILTGGKLSRRKAMVKKGCEKKGNIYE